MPHSMTAFADSESQHDWGMVRWEISSVNHRHLNVRVHLPEGLRRLEPKIRERIGAYLKRGQINCTLHTLLSPTPTDTLPIDHKLATQIANAARVVARLLPDPAPITPIDILKWPGVVQIPAPEPERIERSALELLDHALAGLVDMREREGRRIKTMIQERLEGLTGNVQQIRAALPAVVQAFGERMRARIHELDTTPYVESRIEQEIALMAQRMDVAEELDRLNAHAAEIQLILNQPEAIGRRLDFLMQELNREANTLGAKTASITISRASVDLKVFIEQMREQIQNVE